MIYSFHGKVPSSKIEKCKEMKVSSQIVNLRQWKMLLICTLQIATPFQIYPISRRSQSSNLRDQSFLGSSSSSLFWPSKVNEVIASGKEEQGTARHEEGEAEFYQQVFDSIIKIYATHSEPDHIMPWQRKHPTTSTSSGFVIEGNRIMTNAHSVEHATMIQLQRRGDPTKYQAQLETIANECDLAILKVLEDANDDDDNDKTPDFWDNLSASLEFGSLPALQDEVEVLGYPQGGTGMSVTSGVVSRIELQQYAQSGMHFLAIQIDAAINSGNSGGPVVDVNGKVIGVAFQSLEQAENIGYVVPVTIVQHVLEDIRRNRQYTGFVCLGARFVYLENPQARSFLKLEGHKGGIMVRDCYKTCQAKDHIKPNDVILSIDGIPIGQDGNVLFRPGERGE
jgi:S1-C subfamily serine protease